MRRTRLTTTLAAIPLVAVACGTATDSTHGGPGGSGGSGTTTSTGSHESAHSYAASLLAHVKVPTGATASDRSPSKALDAMPESPGLSKTPVVAKKFWTVGSSATGVLAWLRSNAPDAALLAPNGTGGTGSAGMASTHFLAYRSKALPASIAVGDLYLAVVSTGPSTSAIGAYAVSLAQPPRPLDENVPLTLSKAVIGWSLAPGGTPVEKVLTGPAAVRLARDFNGLRVDTSAPTPCPMMPTTGGDIVVTFTAQGHSWKVDIPACPDISVTRDSTQLPGLAFGKAFLADVKTYAGHLPQGGPPHAPGGVIPLVQPPSGQ